MKKKYSILLLSFICFTSVQIYSQAYRAGYDYHTSIDNGLNVVLPNEQTKANTVPGKGGGTGAESDPFIVATAEDLAEIAIRVNSGTEGSSSIFPNGNMGYQNQYFLVTNDLDLSTYDPWPMIGIPSQKIFYGNFDGGGHVISGLILNASGNQGLFAVLGNYGIVHGIKVQNSQIHNGNYYTGTIVGAAGENTTIYDCHNYCDITSVGYYTGGIVGASWGKIYHCTNTGNINGNEFSGGIVGDFYGTIYNCVNTGNIIGNGSLGGIIGYSAGASTKYLINTGKITGTGVYNGGVIGFVANYNSENTTSCCLNMGDVECQSSSSAAVIGRLWTEAGVPSHADNCFYDKQLTLKKGVAPGGDVVGVAEGKFTHEMIGEEMSEILGSKFIYQEELYPCPEGTEKSEISHVAVAPASLVYTSEEIFDLYNSVNNHFKIALENDVIWESSDEAKLRILVNDAALLGLGCVNFICMKGKAKKTIELTINSVPEIVCNTTILESVTQDICSDTPCLLFNFTKANFITGGYNIYVDGIFLMNIPEWQTVSFTENEITPNETHCFTVTSECINGETDHSNEICKELLITSIKNNQDKTISIFPNPANSSVFIEGFEIKSVSIIDNLGRIVKKHSFNGNRINMINIEDLKLNYYFIIIEMIDGRTIVEKLLLCNY
jgi:hypothetical protein